MAKQEDSVPAKPREDGAKNDPSPPKAIKVASQGIRTAEAGGLFCEAMIQDVLEDKIPYQRANTALRAYGSLLRTVDMNQRYGQQIEEGKKHLELLPDASTQVMDKNAAGTRKE